MCIRDSSEVVLHALAAIITADGFVPLYTEARKTTTVGSYDDIAVSYTHLDVYKRQGLGYVGLPLARLFSTKYKTVGEYNGRMLQEERYV